MYRRYWVGLIVLMGFQSAILAKQGIVKTTDGRSISGDVDDSGGDSVVITSHGVKVTITRINVQTISYYDSVDQEFNDRMSNLGMADIKGRISLARWAMDRQRYDLAQQAADDAKKIDPTNDDVKTLEATINSMQILDARRKAAATQESSSPTPATLASTAPSTQLLSASDINIIRQDELRETDVVRVWLANNLRTRYFNEMNLDAGAQLAFDDKTPTQQALEILHTGNVSLARDVQINSDPASMIQFHDRIQPMVLAGCAAMNCHGGASSDKLYLYPTDKATSTPVWYTNFYILQNYRSKVVVTDVFGRGPVERTLIDRLHPEQSPLVQFGLPAAVASTPHPAVKDWKPMYLDNDSDKNYRTMIDWMGSLSKTFEPDYGLKFELPKGPSTRASEDSMPSASPGTTAPAAVPDTTQTPAAPAPAQSSTSSPTTQMGPDNTTYAPMIQK